MSQSFQNRLVGTIVLVALAVIFLPELLDGQEDDIGEVFPQIEAAPDFVEIKVPDKAFKPIEKKHAEGLDEVADITNFQALPKVKTVTLPAKEASLEKKKEKSVKYVWALQVGTFKSSKNVEKLVAQLRLNGLKVYTVPNKLVDNTLTKVFVGPHISRKEIIKYQKEVERLVKSTGVIVKFDPMRSL